MKGAVEMYQVGDAGALGQAGGSQVAGYAAEGQAAVEVQQGKAAGSQAVADAAQDGKVAFQFGGAKSGRSELAVAKDAGIDQFDRDGRGEAALAQGLSPGGHSAGRRRQGGGQ